MSFLLDTHVWLWMITAPDRLGGPARAAIDDHGNRLFLSAASSWELSIKHDLGRLVLPQPVGVFVPERMRTTGVEGLPIEHADAWQVAALPPHHRDPFDRLLVAQAQTRDLTVLTADPAFSLYDVDVLPAR